MRSYIARHFQVMISTLGDMARSPANTINTTLIVAISLLLPLFLYVVVKSSEGLSESWQGRPQISVFLQANVTTNEAQLIFQEVQLHPSIELAEFVTPKQALEEFRLLSRNSSLDEELAFIGENPLPPSIVLMPNNLSTTPSALKDLTEQLEKIEGIDNIRLDLDWTQRFNAILSVVKRAGLLLSVLLAVALILIVGNTIKLLIYNRRDEIEIAKLVGATNTFVRRPFLYFGSLIGFLGSILALIFLLISASLIDQPLSELASMYQSKSLLHSLSGIEILTVLGVGPALGWLAARWSVAQHLWRIRPR